MHSIYISSVNLDTFYFSIAQRTFLDNDDNLKSKIIATISIKSLNYIGISDMIEKFIPHLYQIIQNGLMNVDKNSFQIDISFNHDQLNEYSSTKFENKLLNLVLILNMVCSKDFLLQIIMKCWNPCYKKSHPDVKVF